MYIEEWLQSVKKLDQLIDAKNAERERLMAIATSVSPRVPDGMPMSNTGTVSKKIEDTVCRLVDLDREINGIIDRYIDCKQAVINKLEKLPANEYGVLHRYYIQHMTYEEIACDMGYSTVHIWRIKQKALEMLKSVVECNTETDV